MIQANAKQKKALVIEDEPILNRILLKTLSKEGFEVDIATNGRIAKDMAKKKVYDIIFSDIRTPEMNGMELYQHFKKYHPELADRVIFTTGDVLSNEVKTFLSETNVPFLAKPFTPDELRLILRDVLN